MSKLSVWVRYFFFNRILGINANVPWQTHWTSTVIAPENISMPADTPPDRKLGAKPCQYIQAYNGIVVGKNVQIAKGNNIIGANHNFYDYTKHVHVPCIVIGDNCWLGVNATILPGVELGPHTVVAAGAVVTKSFPEGNCVIAGVPARKIKDLGEYRGET